MSHRFLQRNYSENDLKKIINARRRKADYINKILDGNVHMRMISESNSTLKDRAKYINNSFTLNNKNNLNNNEQINSFINNNSQRNINQNKLIKNDLNYYNFNTINNNDSQNTNNFVINSYNSLNKPLHCEKRHFPLINNNSLFFKNISPFLVGNSNKMNMNILQYKNNKRYNRNNEDNIKILETPMTIKKSSSMINIPLNPSNYRKINNNKNDYSTKMAYSIGNEAPKQYKYYSPKRFDYEGSRWGDSTYNYYLNSPMRSDISSNWKFPPLYYYNSNKEQKKNNYSNY